MSEPLRPTAVPAPSADDADRLDSWKEIAAYLGREVRTVQLWEKNEGLPVHRHQHARQGSVYAFRPELDAWRQGRAAVAAVSPRMALEAQPEGARINSRRKRFAMFASALALVGIVALTGVASGWFSGAAPEPLRGIPITSALGQELDPSLSPEGTRIAYSWNGENQDNFDIYVKLIGPGPPLRITSDPAADSSPAWSRDGRSIAFLRELPRGRAQVIVAPSLGGPERVIAEVRGWPTPWRFYPGPHLAWSLDGKGLIVSTRLDLAQPFSLQYLTLDTGQFRVITRPPDRSAGDTAPALSRDGRSLVFRRAPGFAIGQLFIQSLSEAMEPVGEPVLLTPQGTYAASPAWTEDGRGIVFSEGNYYEPELWRLNFSWLGRAGKPEALGLTGAFASTSPQSPRLAYASSRIDSNIWEIQLTDKGATRHGLTLLSSTKVDSGAQYSPDGKHIAFHSQRSGAAEIWVAGRDGRNAVQLTSMGDAAGPRWSPDSTQIVFLARSGGAEKIYVVPAAGGRPRQITAGPARNHVPTWSRDGRYIYFRSTRNGASDIWKVPVEGGPEVQVTRNGGDLGIEAPDGTLYYTRQEGDDVGVWKLPPGGQPAQILPSCYLITNLDVTDTGIYVTPRPKPDGSTTVERLRFADGKVETVAELPSPIWFGLSVSPDERSILYSQVDRVESNLMLVDRLR